jgi:hypothetical protein
MLSEGNREGEVVSRMTVRRNPHQMDDCLVLLQYAASHPNDKQTCMSLGQATGIDYRRVGELLEDAREDPYHSMMARAACKYRYEYEVMKVRSRRLLDAVFRGYGE